MTIYGWQGRTVANKPPVKVIDASNAAMLAAHAQLRLDKKP